MSFTPGESHERRKGFASRSKTRLLGDLRRIGARRKPEVFELDRTEERRLVAAARNGDRAALDRLVRSLSGLLYRYGRAFCGDPDDAEDVRQAVYLALLRTLRTYRGEGSLSSWAYVVARNACSRRRRRRSSAGESTSLDAGAPGAPGLQIPDPRQDPEGSLDRDRIAAAIEAAMRTLPPAQREVVLLRDVEGLSAPQAARVLRISERALKSRLHRARLALRAELASFAPEGARAPAPPESIGERCPDTALWLSRFVEGELDADACRALSAHVDRCPQCESACASLRGALRACRDLGGQSLPPEVRRSIRSELGRSIATEPRPGARTASRPRTRTRPA